MKIDRENGEIFALLNEGNSPDTEESLVRKV